MNCNLTKNAKFAAKTSHHRMVAETTGLKVRPATFSQEVFLSTSRKVYDVVDQNEFPIRGLWKKVDVNSGRNERAELSLFVASSYDPQSVDRVCLP
jgi:hypothetical protein